LELLLDFVTADFFADFDEALPGIPNETGQCRHEAGQDSDFVSARRSFRGSGSGVVD